MNKIILFTGMLAALANASCASQSYQTYQDYPRGDYPWESIHSRAHINNIQAWDDYYQTFGRNAPKPPGG